MRLLVDIAVARRSPAGVHTVHARWPHPHDRWPAELAEVMAVPEPPDRRPPDLQLPFELLLGSGEGLRLGRDDVLAELIHRHDTALDARQVTSLHTDSLGRLRALVAGVGRSGARNVGWLSWTLLPDGWRALTPYTDNTGAMVRVHPVEPRRLDAEIAALASRVSS
jgi:hypothetical protein